MASIESTISELICESFSEHILVSSPTDHNYYKLLKTRNYFKSIWIEESALKRYSNFKKAIVENGRFSQIYKWVSDKIENFLFLDDYVVRPLFRYMKISSKEWPTRLTSSSTQAW